MPSRHARHGCHVFQNRSRLVEESFGRCILSTLQVGVQQEIIRMKLVEAAAPVAFGSFLRGRDGGEVGLDILRPHTEPGKDVAAHVSSVRPGGCNDAIAFGSVKSLLCHAGLSHAWMM